MQLTIKISPATNYFLPTYLTAFQSLGIIKYSWNIGKSFIIWEKWVSLKDLSVKKLSDEKHKKAMNNLILNLLTNSFILTINISPSIRKIPFRNPFWKLCELIKDDLIQNSLAVIVNSYQEARGQLPMYVMF